MDTLTNLKSAILFVFNSKNNLARFRLEIVYRKLQKKKFEKNYLCHFYIYEMDKQIENCERKKFGCFLGEKEVLTIFPWNQVRYNFFSGCYFHPFRKCLSFSLSLRFIEISIHLHY